MADLGSLVVLVGENGCGKSRVIETVDWLLQRTVRVGYKQLQNLRLETEKKSEFYEAMRRGAEDNLSLTGASDDLKAFSAMVSPFEGFELVCADGENADTALTNYIAVSNTLHSSFASSRGHFARLAIGVPRGDEPLDPLLIGAPLTYIEDVSRRQAAEVQIERIGFHSENRKIEESFSRLQEMLKEITGMQLDIENGQASLDGQLIHRTIFSDGQLALFRIVVLLHSGALGDAAVPILLDEPERHLHPSRLAKLIDSIRAHLPNAQLWIATHSLSLTAHLAALDPRAIWFGSNGRFERAGLAQQKVVDGLLGGPLGAEQISDFCVHFDKFAACSFSADCLSPPVTATYREGDPQIRQIHDFIAGGPARCLTIVDIGAGQGRLLDGLAHAFGAQLASLISYYAIEPNEHIRSICVNRVRQHYNGDNSRVFASAEEYLNSIHDKADVAVMANVLHEIEIKHWKSVLQDAHSLLCDTGSLLIVEDTRLPRGELAHANGFLILEAQALSTLFGTHLQSSDVKSITSSRGGARLQATAFKRSTLTAVTLETIEKALQIQLKSSINQIRNLRASNQMPSYRLGHEHAYHAQMIANMMLASEDLRVIA